MTGTAKVGGFKRALSLSEIRRCENAQEPKCVCRCHGAMHGKGRIAMDAARSAFEQLPIEDPHHMPTKAEAKQIAKLRKTIRVAHARHGRTVTAGTYRLFWHSQEEVCPLCLEEGKPIPPLGYTCRTCDLPLTKVDGAYRHDLSGRDSADATYAATHDPAPWKSYRVEWEKVN